MLYPKEIIWNAHNDLKTFMKPLILVMERIQMLNNLSMLKYTLVCSQDKI